MASPKPIFSLFSNPIQAIYFFLLEEFHCYPFLSIKVHIFWDGPKFCEIFTLLLTGTTSHWDFLCSDRSKFNLMRWWILVIVTFLGINSDKITKSKDLSIKVIWEIILMEMKKSARRRHCSKIFKTNLKTHISPLLNRPQGCQGCQKNQKDLRTMVHLCASF